MASNYYTEGRIRMMRLQAGLVCCNDIVKDFVQIKISEQLGVTHSDFKTTWRRWCHQNYEHITKYRHWRDRSTVSQDKKDIVRGFSQLG